MYVVVDFMEPLINQFIGGSEEIDDLLQQWFSRQLRAFKMPFQIP